MATLELTVLSLRYSSWSIRPWLALTHAGAPFTTRTVELGNFRDVGLSERRRLGSVSGLFPVLRVDGVPIHESLAITKYTTKTFPNAALLQSSDPIVVRILLQRCGGLQIVHCAAVMHLFLQVFLST